MLGLAIISPTPSSSKNLKTAVACPKKLPAEKSELAPRLKSGCNPLLEPLLPLPVLLPELPELPELCELSDSVRNTPAISVLLPDNRNFQSKPNFFDF